MIAVALGGRVSDELFSRGATTGAADDLSKVTKIAYSLVAQYGMSEKLGLLSYDQIAPQEQFIKPYGEETSNAIDLEARCIVEQQFQRVRALLVEKAKCVKSLADALVERETLAHADVVAILGPKHGQSNGDGVNRLGDSGRSNSPCDAHEVLAHGVIEEP